MKTLYISDLDGTLLNSKKRITEYSADIIQSCIEKGALFTVATARMPYGCDYRLSDIDLKTPGVVTNGVFLYDFHNKKYVSTEKIDLNGTNKVLHVFEQFDLPCFLYLFDQDIEIYYNDKTLEEQTQYFSDRAKESLEIVKLVNGFEKLAKENAVYIAYTGQKSVLDPLVAEIQKIEEVHSAYYLNIYNGLYCLEIFSNKASKRHAILKLKDMLGCDEIVSFGDNLNDLPMIEISDRSYAPSNALPEIKGVVTAVLDSNDEDGVAKFLEKEILDN